jgi:hypothetical protein
MKLFALALTAIIGLWKHIMGDRREKNKTADAAKSQVEKGLDARDPSEITAGHDRLNWQ